MSLAHNISSSIRAFDFAKPWFLPLLVLVLNLGLRSVNVDYSSIYLDEGQTMYQVKRPVTEIVQDYVMKQQNAPLYFLLQHFWVKTFGLSVFSVRYLSVIFMSLAGLLFFLFLRKAHSLALASGASLLFLAVQDFMHFSHEARGYAMIAFLAIASFYAFYFLLLNRKKQNAYLLFLVNTALLYTHYLTIYLFAVQFIVALIWAFAYKNGSFKEYFLSQLAVALCFAPWLGVVFSVMPEQGEFWLGKPTWGLFKNAFYYLVRSKLQTHIVFIIMAVALLAWALRYRKLSAKTNLLYGLLLLWGLLPYFLNYQVGFYIPTFLRKYTFYAAFGFVGLFSASLFILPIGKWLRAAIFMLCAITLFARLDVTTPKDENWKGALAYLQEQNQLKSEETVILVQPYYAYKAFLPYYDMDFFKKASLPLNEMESEGLYFVNNLKDGKRAVSKSSAKQIVLLRSHWRITDPQAELKNWLKAQFDFVEENDDFKKVEISIYNR